MWPCGPGPCGFLWPCSTYRLRRRASGRSRPMSRRWSGPGSASTGSWTCRATRGFPAGCGCSFTAPRCTASTGSNQDGSVESRTGYHAPEGPHGDVVQALRRRHEGGNLRMGVVGLGAGSLLCYAEPGDTLKVYEIDAAVVRLARQHFGALRGCAPGADVKVGDGRLLIRREPPQSLDALFPRRLFIGEHPGAPADAGGFQGLPAGALAKAASWPCTSAAGISTWSLCLALAAGELGLAGMIRALRIAGLVAGRFPAHDDAPWHFWRGMHRYLKTSRFPKAGSRLNCAIRPGGGAPGATIAQAWCPTCAEGKGRRGE